MASAQLDLCLQPSPSEPRVTVFDHGALRLSTAVSMETSQGGTLCYGVGGRQLLQ